MVGATGPRIGSRRLDADRRAHGAASRRRTWADRGQSELRCGRPGRCAGPHGTRRVSRALEGMRFALDPPTALGLGHVFRKGGVEIDVLAPDGLHTKARRITVPPAHTVQVPGGTQALRRTELVSVRLGRRRGTLPRPNLLGAILVKTRAVDIDDVPENQRL